MQYFISFLEGIITFISPCLLPMLPVYVSYFAGADNRTMKKTVKNAVGFVSGFTLVFVSLGALAGTLGSFLAQYKTTKYKRNILPLYTAVSPKTQPLCGIFCFMIATKTKRLLWNGSVPGSRRRFWTIPS